MKLTRQKYLKKIQDSIMALPLEEQKEVMDYYTNYFEDAGDDEKVIEELGDPEKLAQEIKEKFACVPSKTDSAEKTEDKTEDTKSEYHGNDYSTGPSAQKFTFDEKDITNLEIGVGAAEIVIIGGSSFSVETRGIAREAMECSVSAQKTLTIKNTKRLPSFNFFSHENMKNFHPRMLITVPENASLKILKISVGAGSLTAKTPIKCQSALLDVAAGNLVLNDLAGGQVNLRCGMGNLQITGTVSGINNIDCGMGNIGLKINGNQDDYSFDARVGLGEIRFGDIKKSGIKSFYSDSHKQNHFSVVCGLGSVNISFK